MNAQTRVTRYQARFSAPVPSGWAVKEQVTIFEEEGRAQVVASSEPVDVNVKTEDYAKTQGDALRSGIDGYEEISCEQTQLFGGRDGWLRHFTWRGQGGQRLAELHMYFVENGRGYIATATTPLQSFDDMEQQVRDVLEGLLIDGAEPKS